jgi:hypothetical protein
VDETGKREISVVYCKQLSSGRYLLPDEFKDTLTASAHTVIMNGMGRTLFYALLFAVAFALAGCQEDQNVPVQPQAQSTKLSDIQPLYKPDMPPELHFRIYTFQLDRNNLANADHIFEILEKEKFQFTDSEAFKANGFAAGSAKADAWQQLGEILQQAKAVGVRDSAMIVFDDGSQDLFFANTKQKRSINYYRSQHDSFKKNITQGQLAWRIRAWALEDKEKSAMVQIMPVSKPNVPPGINPFVRRKRPRMVIFDAVGFELEMTPGDFIVLSPESYDLDTNPDTIDLTNSEESELSKETPKISTESNLKKLTLGSLFFEIENKPLIRLFVVVCVGTGN